MTESSSAKRARVQKGPQAPRFIVIEGPLRVGKTTLARILAERLHARRIYDCEDNPFLADFYREKPGAAFRAPRFTVPARCASLSGVPTHVESKLSRHRVPLNSLW